MSTAKTYTVYELRSTRSPLVYIGLTSMPLQHRLRCHLSQCRNPPKIGCGCYSSILIRMGKEEDVSIHALTQPFTSKAEASKVERFYVETTNNVNHNVPTRSNKELMDLKALKRKMCPYCKRSVSVPQMKKHQRTKYCRSFQTCTDGEETPVPAPAGTGEGSVAVILEGEVGTVITLG